MANPDKLPPKRNVDMQTTVTASEKLGCLTFLSSLTFLGGVGFEIDALMYGGTAAILTSAFLHVLHYLDQLPPPDETE